MGRTALPTLPAKYKHGGLFGRKPVDPALGSSSESNVAVDVEPGVDDVDDAGPAEEPKQKRQELDLSKPQFECFVSLFHISSNFHR